MTSFLGGRRKTEDEGTRAVLTSFHNAAVFLWTLFGPYATQVTRRPLPHHRTYGYTSVREWLRQHFLEQCRQCCSADGIENSENLCPRMSGGSVWQSSAAPERFRAPYGQTIALNYRELSASVREFLRV